MISMAENSLTFPAHTLNSYPTCGRDVRRRRVLRQTSTTIPAVSDQKELPDALTIILDHLQDTIYNQAGKKVSDCVLQSKD